MVTGVSAGGRHTALCGVGGGSGDATWRLLARQAMLLTLTSHYRTSPNKVTFRVTSSLCLLSARVPAKDTPPHGKQFDCHLDPCNPEAKHGEGAHRTGLRTWGLKTMFILRQLVYFSDRSTTVAIRKSTLGLQYFSTRTESRTSELSHLVLCPPYGIPYQL